MDSGRLEGTLLRDNQSTTITSEVFVYKLHKGILNCTKGGRWGGYWQAHDPWATPFHDQFKQISKRFKTSLVPVCDISWPIQKRFQHDSNKRSLRCDKKYFQKVNKKKCLEIAGNLALKVWIDILIKILFKLLVKRCSGVAYVHDPDKLRIASSLCTVQDNNNWSVFGNGATSKANGTVHLNCNWHDHFLNVVHQSRYGRKLQEDLTIRAEKQKCISNDTTWSGNRNRDGIFHCILGNM